MPNDDRFACRVCGLLATDPPWGDDGRTPSFEICSCCGVEFGYEDSTPQGCRTYRAKWIASGNRWWDESLTPADWNLEIQLENTPILFR